MESAAKSLLIAAAVLMTVMILTLLMIFWNDISSYFTAKHEEKMLQQLLEFNDKFQNYNGQTIRGNELVSIMNRIVDYNNYQSDMVGYEPIKIRIDLQGHQNEFKFGGETGGSDLIRNKSEIVNYSGNVIDDEHIKFIATTSSRLTSDSTFLVISSDLTDTQLQKMSANIEHIVNDDPNIPYNERTEYLDEYIKYRDQLLTRILGASNVKPYEDTLAYKDWITVVKNATYQYRQFTQFKRAMFKCTNVTYNDINGRVNKMEFEVILENGKIKFD